MSVQNNEVNKTERTCPIEPHIPVGRINVYTSNTNGRQNLKMFRENTEFMRETPEEELTSA